MIAAERERRPFLTFELIAEPNMGPLALRMTGPAGAKEFSERHPAITGLRPTVALPLYGLTDPACFSVGSTAARLAPPVGSIERRYRRSLARSQRQVIAPAMMPTEVTTVAVTVSVPWPHPVASAEDIWLP